MSVTIYDMPSGLGVETNDRWHGAMPIEVWCKYVDYYRGKTGPNWPLPVVQVPDHYYYFGEGWINAALHSTPLNFTKATA
jgi:hypothetical protein